MTPRSNHIRPFAFAASFCLAVAARAEVVSGQIGNLTSRAFDVFVRSDAPAVSPSLEVFTDAEGTAAANTVAEYQPLFTGATDGDDYARRQANRATRAALTATGNTLFRVTNCETGSSYYVRVRFGGQPAWPADGTLQAVRTLPSAEWNGGARQYLMSLGRNGDGWIGALRAENAAAPLLSVAGDRAATNSTFFFNLTDLMGTNGLPLDIPEDAPLTFTLYGRLGDETTATTLYGPPQAPDTLIASSDAFQKNLLNLVVASASGLCSPTPGEHLLFDGSQVTCRVDQALITQVSTQFVAYGWTGSGSVPVNGRSTSFTFALSTPSSISWSWRTNFWLEVVSDHGAVNLDSGWYRSGTALQASATPNAEWLFSQWSGLASSSDPVVALVVGGAGQLTANFSPVLVPGGDGMPAWWLTQAGLAGADRDPDADPDHDGISNRREWQADTSPTNKASALRITALARSGDTLHLSWSGGREAKQLVEMLEGDLSRGEWHSVATNLPPTDTVGTCAIRVEGKPTVFFRIKAER